MPSYKSLRCKDECSSTEHPDDAADNVDACNEKSARPKGYHTETSLQLWDVNHHLKEKVGNQIEENKVLGRRRRDTTQKIPFNWKYGNEIFSRNSSFPNLCSSGDKKFLGLEMDATCCFLYPLQKEEKLFRELFGDDNTICFHH